MVDLKVRRQEVGKKVKDRDRLSKTADREGKTEIK